MINKDIKEERTNEKELSKPQELCQKGLTMLRNCSQNIKEYNAEWKERNILTFPETTILTGALSTIPIFNVMCERQIIGDPKLSIASGVIWSLGVFAVAMSVQMAGHKYSTRKLPKKSNL